MKNRTRRAHAAPPAPTTGAVVWILQEPLVDRRTNRVPDLSRLRRWGTPRWVLPPGSTVHDYATHARALWEAWDAFEDGDAVVFLGGDLATITLVDDILRQRGVERYVWLKHLGFDRFQSQEKDLRTTTFSEA